MITLGNNNAVKETLPVYMSQETDFKLMRLLHGEQISVKKISVKKVSLSAVFSGRHGR